MIMEVLKVRLCFSVLIRFLNKIGLVGLVSMGVKMVFIFKRKERHKYAFLLFFIYILSLLSIVPVSYATSPPVSFLLI